MSGIVPFFLRGVVVKGFGRGSKELGCPTANFSEEVVNEMPEYVKNGIYYGFAQGMENGVRVLVHIANCTCIHFWSTFFKRLSFAIFFILLSSNTTLTKEICPHEIGPLNSRYIQL